MHKTSKGYVFGDADGHVKKLCTDCDFAELKGANDLAFEKQQKDDTTLDEDGQRRDRQTLGKLFWLGRSNIRKGSVSAPNARRHSHQSQRSQRQAAACELVRESNV